MKNELQAQAQEKNWGFFYGRRDFQNLEADNLDVEKTYLFLDPIKRKNLKGDTGAVYAIRYRGHFMLLRKSSLDNKYSGDIDTKYEKHIEPLEIDLDSLESSLIGCDGDYDVDWESTEIINVFNENMDGLIVNYTITQTL